MLLRRRGLTLIKKEIYKKDNKSSKDKENQLILYIVFGVLTTLINIAVFKVSLMIGFNYTVSNLIAFVIAIIFAYLTNRKLVFNSLANTSYEYATEFFKFVLSRSIVLAFEIIGLYILIEFLNINIMMSKIVMTIVTVILNFLLSKLFIFK